MKILLIFAFISFLSFISQLQSISVAEYIQQHGMPLQYGWLLLSEKNLTDLTGLQDIPNKDQVYTLNIANNQLTELPEYIFNGFNNLQDLFLNGNQLTTLPVGIFNGLNNLRHLSLDNNQLTMLPAGIFSGLNNLQVLFLNGNRLTTLPAGIFNDLNNLSQLVIQGNNFDLDFIPTLKDMIQNLPNLQLLNGKPKNLALKEEPFSTLFETAAKKIAQNIDQYRKRLDELSLDVIAKLPLPEHVRSQLISEKVQQNIDEYSIDALDKLPLPREERIKFITEKIQKNIGAYRNRLRELPSEILDALNLTPAQRAAIAAEKRL